MRISNSIAQYLERQMGIYSPRTIKIEERHLRLFYDYLKGKEIKELGLITREDIIGYQQYLKEKRQKNLENRGLSILKKYFCWLRGKGEILIDPLSGIEIPRYIKGLPKRALSEEEVIKLLNTLKTDRARGIRDRALIELLYSTGIRREEAVRINIYDLDQSEGLLKVKSGKRERERIVPLGKLALCWINRYIREVLRLLRCKDQEALWISLNQGRRIVPETVSDIVRRHAKRAGLGVVSAHALRHACASHMLKNGADIRYIQQMLGHSSIAATQVYTRIQPNDLIRVYRLSHPRGKMQGAGVKKVSPPLALGFTHT